MTSIKIGDRDVAVTRPADLDAQMTASTGCNCTEQAAILARNATPFTVARVLHPMLGPDEGLPIAALAGLIAAADSGAVARQVAALLVPPAALPNA